MLLVLRPMRCAHQEERYDSVRVLWAQVLKRAIFDFVTLRHSSKLKDKRDFRSAERWLFSDEAGLVDTCVALGWPLSALRVRARAMTKGEIRKMEFRDRDVVPELPLRVEGGEHGDSQ